jgi:hypothetical protein
VTTEDASAIDVRIEIETALAPLMDLARENHVLLRGLLEDLEATRAEIARVRSVLDAR